MKNKIYKLFSVLLTVALVFTTCICAINTVYADEYTYSPTMSQGTIDGGAGAIMSNVTTRVYTEELISVADTVKVSLASGYKAYYHFYDASGNWLKSSGAWIEGDRTVAQLIEISNTATYFKVVVGTTDNAYLTPSTLPTGTLAVTLAAAPEQPEEIEGETPVMAQGTIDGGAGNISANVGTRVYTKDLIPVSDYERIIIAYGYKAYIHCYDADGGWLTSFGWKEASSADLEVAVSETKAKSMDTVYFRVVMGTRSNANITPDSFPADALKLVKKSEKHSDFTFENVFEIGPKSNGPWQEGAIFDGKLFLFNHAEWGKVVDIETGEDIGTFMGDTTDFFSVHSNSMCFGTEYYSANDKYPLLYSSVYNNYEGKSNQYEGHCGVYRIVENGSNFTAQLVQVIKIGFTEDLTMWKSKSNNGDVCPFGNFIVDTDKNDLYAYVMRDATQTTRYYKFDLPAVSEGTYNSTFGCKTVTLNTTDIKDQFDTEYSVYLQGADYLDGMILSSSGLGHGRDGGAILRLVDLETKEVVKIYDAISAGVYNEPEVIAVDPETEKVYYGSTDGQLRWLTCIDKYREEKAAEDECTHEYDNACDAECNLCFEIREVADHVYDNDCDADCNVCSDIREVAGHKYDSDYDAECNICGQVREVPEVGEAEIREIDGVKYLYVNGKTTAKGIYKVGNDYYMSDWGGVPVTSGKHYTGYTYCDLPSGSYLIGEGGKLFTGVVEENGILYLYVNGRTSVKGLFKVDEDYYFADWGGVVYTDGKYYVHTTHCDLEGRKEYTFGKDGKMLQGVVEIDGTLYLYQNGITSVRGLFKVGEDYYFADWGGVVYTDGRYYVHTTHCDLEGRREYSFGSDGKMLDGVVEIDGQLYLYQNGSTSTKGLFKIGDDYYFADWGGVIMTDGEYYVHTSHCDLEGGKVYTFDVDGKMIL